MEKMKALDLINTELVMASAKHGPFVSANVGCAIISVQYHELWEEVKKDPWERTVRLGSPEAEKEAVRVAAMALRFLIDLC